MSDWTITEKSGVLPDCFILYVGNVTVLTCFKIIVKSVQLPRYGGAVEGLTVEGCSVVVVGSRLTIYSFSEVTAAVVVEGSDTDEEIWSASVVVERADTENVIWSASTSVEVSSLNVLVDESRKKVTKYFAH